MWFLYNLPTSMTYHVHNNCGCLWDWQCLGEKVNKCFCQCIFHVTNICLILDLILQVHTSSQMAENFEQQKYKKSPDDWSDDLWVAFSCCHPQTNWISSNCHFWSIIIFQMAHQVKPLCRMNVGAADLPHALPYYWGQKILPLNEWTWSLLLWKPSHCKGW